MQLLLIFLVGALFTFMRGAIFNMAGERVVARVRRRLFAAILSQEIGFFDANKTGDVSKGGGEVAAVASADLSPPTRS